MKNSTNSKSKRNIMAITILCILGVLSVAYAAFSTNLKIGLQGTADNKWNVQFDHVPSTGEIFVTQGSKTDDSDYSTGTVDWTNGSTDADHTNISITGLKLANLDDTFYYVFTIKNNGTAIAQLSEPPTSKSLPASGSTITHSYYADDGTEKSYNVTYNAKLFKVDTKPTTLDACKTACKDDNEMGSKFQNYTLNKGAEMYLVLRVDATCSIQSGDAINTLNPIPGNTTFTGDSLEFGVFTGKWVSVDGAVG